VGGNESLLSIHVLGGAVGRRRSAPPVLQWVVKTRQPIFASPTVAGDTGDIFIGSLDGGMRAVAPAGTLLWVYETKQPIYGSVALSNTTVFFGTLLSCLRS
jgi:outer membrane protein assembly factor BamB